MAPREVREVRIPRAPLLAFGAAALLAGMWAGLVRIGWMWPVPLSLPYAHGPLMVSGFLGTVIALERATALRRAWGFAAPALAALGVIALFAGQWSLAALALAAASATMLAIFVQVLRVDPSVHHVVMATGAACWLAGNLAWVAGKAVPQVVLLWLGFLVLTIVGERLELNRLLAHGRSTRAMLAVAAAVVPIGAAISLGPRDLGFRITGAALVALAAWLLQFDLARKTVRMKGLTRFIAACLLAGYVWLGVGGGLMLVHGGPWAGPTYDAMLHAVFVGFVFSMIFGHAPLILPSVVRIKLPFHARFYVHAALLHLSLVARLAGDLAGSAELRRAGGLLNAVAILLFLGSTLAAVRRKPAPTVR